VVRSNGPAFSTGLDFASFSRIAQGDGAWEDRRRNP
jgi:hypothetical protein